MHPLLIIILIMNITFFTIDMNEDWREVKEQKVLVIAALAIVYMLLGFLSPALRLWCWAKERSK